jgi:hypothetical protein
MQYKIQWCIDQIKKLWIALASLLSDIEARFVHKSGDTMTGPLVLPGDPTEDLQAATKQYVDGATVTTTLMEQAFLAASATWVWNHNLGHRLGGIQVFDINRNIMFADTVASTVDQIVVTHLFNASGYITAVN